MGKFSPGKKSTLAEIAGLAEGAVFGLKSGHGEVSQGGLSYLVLEVVDSCRAA